MESIILSNIGLKGLATDPSPWTLAPEFITAGQNFRIFAGTIISSGGSAVWSTAPGSWFPAHPFHVGSVSGDFWLVAGRDAVYAFDGVNWFDISSAAGYVNIGTDQELLWTSCMLGAIPIMNNPQAFPEYWSPQQTAVTMWSSS